MGRATTASLKLRAERWEARSAPHELLRPQADGTAAGAVRSVRKLQFPHDRLEARLVAQGVQAGIDL